MNITDVSGIGDATAQRLETHGFDSVEDVAQASIDQLATVPGIGMDRAAALRESARGLLGEAAEHEESPETAPTTAGEGEDTPQPVAAPDDDDAATGGSEDGKGKKRKKGKKKYKKDKRDKKGKERKKKEKKKKTDGKKDKGRKKRKNRRQ